MGTQRRLRSVRLLPMVAALGFAACSGDDDTPPGSCWRGDEPVTPGGRVELGTGFFGFESLADAAEPDLPLEQGPQGGYHFIAHARIWGLDPGDAAVPDQTPQTRFLAYLEDGTEVALRECPFEGSYLESGDGYELDGGRLLRVDDSRLADMLDHRVRISVEVVDRDLRYATDERWVTAVPQELLDAGPTGDDPVDAGLAP